MMLGPVHLETAARFSRLWQAGPCNRPRRRLLGSQQVCTQYHRAHERYVFRNASRNAVYRSLIAGECVRADSAVTLAWAAPHDNGGPIQNYEILYKEVGAAGYTHLGSSETVEFLAERLLPVHEYVFKVIAVNEAGKSEESDESETARTAPGPPSPPAQVTQKTATPFTLELQWEAPIDNGSAITIYNVEKAAAEDRDNWESVGAVRPPEDGLATFCCSDLRPNAGYLFRVNASNAIGASQYSEASIAFQTQPAPPEAPSKPELSNATASTLSISWSEPETHGNPILEYRLERLSGSRDAKTATDWELVGVGAATTMTVPDLQPATSFYFRVVATSTVGDSEASETAGRFQTRAAAPARPFPPHAVEAGVTSSSVSVSWGEPIDNGSRITNYRLECCKEGERAPVWSLADEGIELEGEATGLEPATKYKFRVIATNHEGDSANGEEALVQTKPDRPATPLPPHADAKRPRIAAAVVVSAEQPRRRHRRVRSAA
eukprot:SAG11_NODE_2785_length_2975_cov_1.465229_2_plen_493_part_00